MVEFPLVTKIVGSGLFGDQTRARHRALVKGQIVTLVRDPLNEHDPWATMAMIDTPQGYRPVGYIPAAVSLGVGSLLDEGARLRAEVVVGYAAYQVPQIKIRKLRTKSKKGEEPVSKTKTRHVRRHRRQDNMKMRSGGKFKVGHANPSGRTGSVHSRKTKPKE